MWRGGKMIGKGMPEYEDKHRLIKKWCLIFIYIFIQMMIIMSAWVVAGLYFFSLFPIDSVLIKRIGIIIWCALFYIPFLYFKIMCIYRNIQYCYVYCNGTRCEGTLLKVEEKNMNIGWNKRIVLYYRYENGGNVVNAVHKVNCVDMDFSILGLRYVYGKYVIPEPTIIPVVVYNGKSIVIHNNCGMYDVAHYNGMLRPGNYY